MKSTRPANPSLFVNLFLTTVAVLLAGCAGPTLTMPELLEEPPVAVKPFEPPIITPKLTPNPDADVAVDITFDIFKANAALNRGDYAGAVKLFRSELKEEQAKTESSWVQLSYLNHQLGFALKHVAQHDEALEYYQKALAIRLKQLGPDHPDVANSYNNIGEIHRAKAEYDKALEYYQKSLAIVLKQLGADHPYVATSYNNIGLVHKAKAEYDKALEYYQKSLAIMLKQLGPDHPSVATSYNNIAFVYKAKKDLPKAKEYWGKAYAILLKKLGPNHPDTKVTKAELDALNK
jgi:tetratricopeptide (TPR) repeat protein